MALCFKKKQYLPYLERYVLKVKLAQPRRQLHDYRYTRKSRQSSERVAARPRTCSTQHVKHCVLNAETELFACVVCKVCMLRHSIECYLQVPCRKLLNGLQWNSCALHH